MSVPMAPILQVRDDAGLHNALSDTEFVIVLFDVHEFAPSAFLAAATARGSDARFVYVNVDDIELPEFLTRTPTCAAYANGVYQQHVACAAAPGVDELSSFVSQALVAAPREALRVCVGGA